ncbi:MAG: hypothetical protein P8008_02570 [Gammaproteobacteria bacterium]
MKALVALFAVFMLLCACEPQAAQQDTTVTEQADLMDQPLDGSSVEAFEAGLDRIREANGDGDYKQVKSAVDYLLVYDLAARRDRATLYSRLDGMTAREVVEQAQAR